MCNRVRYIGDGERCGDLSWISRVSQRTPHGVLGFVLVLLLQRLRPLGRGQSRAGNMVLSRMHEHLGIFPCSYPLCNQIASSRTGDNEHCITDDHGSETDLPCAEGIAVNQDMLRRHHEQERKADSLFFMR